LKIHGLKKPLLIILILILLSAVFIVKKHLPLIAYIAHDLLNISPIKFYGLVVDQYGNGVNDAKIIVTISKYGNNKTVETITDIDGRFKIKGKWGTSLKIDAILKSDYVVNLKNKAHYTYGRYYGGRHRPDPDNPVLFDIWRKTGGRTLVKGSIKFDIESGDQPVYVDLMSKKIYKIQKENADFTVQYVMEDQSSRNYNWSLIVKVIQGGIILTDDTYLFRAPEIGYNPIFIYDSSKENNNKLNRPWKMYLKSKNGKYFAAIEWKTYSYHDGRARIILDYYLNAYSSTNLEVSSE
jgi:hypothetical protein